MTQNLKNRVWKNEIYNFLINKDCIFSNEFIDNLFILFDKKINVSEKIFGLLFLKFGRKYKVSI